MCLHSLKPIPKRLPKYGWKVFIKSKNRQLKSEYQGAEYRPTNVFIPAKSRVISSSSGEMYPSGWHIFTQEKDAVRWAHLSLMVAAMKGQPKLLVVRKVEFKGVMVYGIQKNSHCTYSNVIVAAQMKILPEVKPCQRSAKKPKR